MVDKTGLEWIKVVDGTPSTVGEKKNVDLIGLIEDYRFEQTREDTPRSRAWDQKGFLIISMGRKSGL